MGVQVTVLDELRRGQVPDPRLTEAVRSVFEAFEAGVDVGDGLAGALTGVRDVDVWRTWRKAHAALAGARPKDAVAQLEASFRLHPPGEERITLGDVERSALRADCLAQAQRPAAAIDALERCRIELLAFARLAETQPAVVAADVREMLDQLVGLPADQFEDHDVIGAWVLGRGLALLLDVFRDAVEQLLVAREPEAATAVAKGLPEDLVALHETTGCALGDDQLAKVEFTLGNCWTPLDAELALEHFRIAAALKPPHLAAEYNAANCLARLGRYGEARAVYAALESEFELAGDYLAAAQVWTAECVALWKERRDPNVVGSVAGAIEMFEQHLPADADPSTLYTVKRMIEPAYSLYVAAAAASGDRSDERLDGLLACVWAMMRPELKADLGADAAGPGWPALLSAQQRPLAIVKTALAPFTGTGVVHLCSATDRMVWLLYGFDRSGEFRLETSVGDAGHAAVLTAFLAAMAEQLAADLRRDPAQVRRWEAELEERGAELASQLDPDFVDALLDLDHVFYMPHPFGNVDEFPLGGLRFGRSWLAETTTITRSPTPNHLRECLSPNRFSVRGTGRAAILVGDPGRDTNALREAAREEERVEHVLGVLGFAERRSGPSGLDDLTTWLDGDVSLVHYIGHGFAGDVNEGLPLMSGEVFTPVDLDRLSGVRTPFVFLCACEAGRVRHGSGGYQTGLASRLVERSAPAALAFTMPVPESTAYSLARTFYRNASAHPFGVAVRETQRQAAGDLPAYARLALAAYGDPELRLGELAAEGPATMSGDRAVTWDSCLRNYAVLRTEDAREECAAALDRAPEELRAIGRELVSTAFHEPCGSSSELIDRLKAAALDSPDGSAPERLSLAAALCLERAHAVGLDAEPIGWPEPGAETRALVFELHFAACVGVALFDTRLAGLSNALLGRLITWDQANLDHSAVFLGDAVEKLAECAPSSPFVARIRSETISIIRQFGGVPPAEA